MPHVLKANLYIYIYIQAKRVCVGCPWCAPMSVDRVKYCRIPFLANRLTLWLPMAVLCRLALPRTWYAHYRSTNVFLCAYLQCIFIMCSLLESRCLVCACVQYIFIIYSLLETQCLVCACVQCIFIISHLLYRHNVLCVVACSVYSSYAHY